MLHTWLELGFYEDSTMLTRRLESTMCEIPESMWQTSDSHASSQMDVKSIAQVKAATNLRDFMGLLTILYKRGFQVCCVSKLPPPS